MVCKAPLFNFETILKTHRRKRIAKMVAHFMIVFTKQIHWFILNSFYPKINKFWGKKTIKIKERE